MCKYAISTEEEYLINKDIDYRIYLTFLKDSTYNKNLDFRYVYNSNYYLNKNYFLEKLNISKGNLNKLIKNFLKFNLIEKDTVLNENFELKQIYKFNELNNNFVLLSDKEVEKLLTLTSNEIKTYLILRYLLADIKEKNIELGYIAKNIGLSELNTTRTIKKYIENLRENNLIEYNYYFEFIENKNIKRYKFRIKE